MEWRGFFRRAMRGFLFAALIWSPALDAAAPPDEEPVRLEYPDDPYVPQPPEPGGGDVSESQAPPGSVQVNVNEDGMNILGDAANEPSLAINLLDPANIVIGWRQFDTVESNFRQGGWAYSLDAGLTWTFPGVLEEGVFRSDPVLAANADGVFFYSSLKDTFCIDVWRSTNGGVTWPEFDAAFGGDKQWIEIDTTGGIGDGHIYQAWSRGAECQNETLNRTFTRSTDGGVTWLDPIAIPNTPTFGTVAVGPDGELYVAGINAPPFNNNSNFVIAKSTNAEDPDQTPTWDSSVVGNFLGGALRGSAGPNPGGLLGQVWIAVNYAAGDNYGHVYLLASVNPTGDDPLDVKFSRSTDGGVSWSTPVRVNDDAANSNAWQWFGTMAVAPNGRIDAVWNDTRGLPFNRSRTYYAFSVDEGASWSANRALTRAWNSLIGHPNQSKIGDYYDLISDEEGASLAYAATFNGEQDVYFTRITPNDCNTNGLGDDDEVTSGTALDCNTNEIPDECDVLVELLLDCNTNGVGDVCDIGDGVSDDCNDTDVPDECEPGHEDCDSNGVLDQCEDFIDCNTNAHLDDCDLASMESGDCNTTGIPDECETPSQADAADTCADAQLVTSGVDYFGQTTTSTNTDGSAGCAPTGRDVYYRYAPISDGTVTLSMCGLASYDTVLSVHTGCPATSNNQISGACNDDGCAPGGPSIISDLAVTAGTEYIIRIAGYNNGGGGGDVGLFGITLDGPPGFGDCNTNDVPDECEIADGGDANTNGLLDACEPFPDCPTCPGDLDGGGIVDGDDIGGFVDCLFAFPPADLNCGCADLDGDHQIDEADVALYVNKLLAGGCP